LIIVNRGSKVEPRHHSSATLLTQLQKKSAQAIVNLFETGAVRGDYAKVTIMPGDPGHLTYGRSQTTLASGNLYLLIKAYCSAPGAELATELGPYLGALEARDVNLDHDARLHRLLRDAGADRVMVEVQDGFFERVYWQPAQLAAQRLEITTPLGLTIVYDSWIHGSWARMRDRATERLGGPASIGERPWVEGYVAVRREWLAGHSNHLLRRTVYRMDAFTTLMWDGRWNLDLPFTCRGVVIDEPALGEGSDVRAHDDEDELPLLRLRSPMLRSSDVARLQAALNREGFDLIEDGAFGPATDAALRAFQAQQRLTVDGILGPASRAALAL